MPEALAVRKVRAEPGAALTRLEVAGPGPREVLVKIRAASVCGTDKHIYNWDRWAEGRLKPPLTFGHEACGEIVEVGTAVDSVRVGDFVSLETHVPCGRCRPCRTGQRHVCSNLRILGVDMDGCFAELLVVPAICAWKNPPDLDPAIAAIQEPFGNAVYCVDEADVGCRTVAIFGDGPIACFAAGIARASGAAHVTVVGLSPSRLEIARTMGAHRVIDAGDVDPVEALRDEHGEDGVDVVLEMAGVAVTVQQGLEVLRKGGSFIAFGIPPGDVQLDYTNAIVFKEARIRGINGRRMFETWYQTRTLLTSGMVDPTPVITHTFRLEEYDRAFELLNEPESPVGKVVLTP